MLFHALIFESLNVNYNYVLSLQFNPWFLINKNIKKESQFQDN